MEFARNLSRQLAQLWEGLSPRRRLALAAVGVGLVVGILALAYWASQPDYQVLYSGLAAEDAGTVTAKLQALGVPFRLAAGGTTVLVPSDQVQQRRIELAVEGLPAKGDKGFGLFDQSPLGMTPFTQHVNYLRALQAELAKTIMQIDPVVFARVHIVRPDPTPFIRDQKPTTASVVLRLRPGAALTRNVSAGIVALVSRSVEGLAPEHVTLLDTHGRMLSEPIGSDTAAAGTHLEHRRELESYLASRAESMLAQVLGPGRAVVRVTADMNFQRLREKKETYNPDLRVATSEKITTNKSNTSPGGVQAPAAGMASNVGKGAALGGGNTPGSNSLEEVIQTDFVVSKVTQEVEDRAGTVERLTVAAMVDLTPAEGEKGPALTLEAAQDIIKQAVGFRPSRDEIKVTNVRLQAPEPSREAEEEWQRVQHWQNVVALVRNGSLGLAALVTFLLGWMLLRRVRPAPPPAPAPVAEPTAPEAGASLGRLAAVAEQHPDVIARVLANWLEQSEQQQRSAA